MKWLDLLIRRQRGDGPDPDRRGLLAAGTVAAGVGTLALGTYLRHQGTADAQPASAQPQRPSPSNSVDIITFGADPTGRLDSAPAIRAAINAASDVRLRVGHAAVLVPPGVYAISADLDNTGPIALNSGVDLYAQPGTAVLRLFVPSPRPRRIYPQMIGVPNVVANVRIHGLIFEGLYDAEPNVGGGGLVITGSDIILERCVFRRFRGHGVVLAGCYRSGVLDCRFEDSCNTYSSVPRDAQHPDGVHMDSGTPLLFEGDHAPRRPGVMLVDLPNITADPAARQLSVPSARFLTGGFEVGRQIVVHAPFLAPIMLTLEKVTQTAVTVKEGFPTLPRSPFNATIRMVGAASGNYAVGNTFSRCGGDVVELGGQHDFLFADNRMVDLEDSLKVCPLTYSGLFLSTSSSIAVIGNHFSTVAGAGIDAWNVSDLQILGNSFERNANVAIALGGGIERAVVSGNIMLNNGQAGVSPIPGVADGNERGGLLMGNTVDDTKGGYGFCSDVLVSGNLIADTQKQKTQRFGIVVRPGANLPNLVIDETNLVYGNDIDFGFDPSRYGVQSATFPRAGNLILAGPDRSVVLGPLSQVTCHDNALFVPNLDFAKAGLAAGDIVTVAGWQRGIVVENNGIFTVAEATVGRLTMRQPLRRGLEPQHNIYVERVAQPSWRRMTAADMPPLADLVRLAGRPRVTGSISDGSALRSMLRALSALGLISDETRP